VTGSHPFDRRRTSSRRTAESACRGGGWVAGPAASPDHVVEVRADAPTGRVRVGSGLLVTGGRCSPRRVVFRTGRPPPPVGLTSGCLGGGWVGPRWPAGRGGLAVAVGLAAEDGGRTPSSSDRCRFGENHRRGDLGAAASGTGLDGGCWTGRVGDVRCDAAGFPRMRRGEIGLLRESTTKGHVNPLGGGGDGPV
jgi:hypothetical protein